MERAPVENREPGGLGCVSVFLASSQNTMKREKRWETPTP